MSWMGKILGGGIGFMVGGPLGAILGAVLGHHTLDGGRFLSENEQRHGIFFVATFSMLGKLSKADGQVTAEEIALVEQVMRDSLKLPPDARDFAIRLFNAAKDSDESFEAYALQFYNAFEDQPEVLCSLVDLLLRMSHADGVLHPAEDRMIEQAVSIFGVQAEYVRLKARYSSHNDLEKCFELLGASPDEALRDIKKKYRRLAMQYHPDRVLSKGVSPELAATAEERFKEIQHAYDVIEKHLT